MCSKVASTPPAILNRNSVNFLFYLPRVVPQGNVVFYGCGLAFLLVLWKGL